MAEFSSTSHWRDSARSPRFFLIDARAAFPIFIFLLHIKLWTGLAVIFSAIFFSIIEHYGFTVPIFFRVLRNFIAGSQKNSQLWWVK